MNVKNELRIDLENVERAVVKSVSSHSTCYLFEGVVLVVLGVIVFLIPPLALIAISFLLGWVLLVSGVMGFISTFASRGAPGFWWSLLSAILAVVIGIALLAMPVESSFLLTVFLVAFFIVEGAASILFALEHKRALAGKWEWMAASGVIDLVMGILIFTYIPSKAAWVVAGLLIGINMVVGGVALIGMALHARKEASLAAPKNVIV